jgi:8-oxo-dGTP diphosphatase
MGEAQQFPKLGVSACVWRGGEVLMIQRAKPPVIGIWSLPGGHVEAGEEALAAAHRELREETGVEAALSELVGLYDVIHRDEAGQLIRHYAVACYAGRWIGGEPRAASDALTACWMAPEEIVELPLTPHVADAVARARKLLDL